MLIFLLIIFGLIIIDQLSKLIVVNTLVLGESNEIITNFFSLTSHRNSGAAWGILEGRMLFFYIITVLVLIFLFRFLHIDGDLRKKPGLTWSLIFMISGAIGNFIDRLIHKEVVDFFDFIIFGYDYPIFNIADSLLVIGVFLLFLDTLIDLFKSKKTE